MFLNRLDNDLLHPAAWFLPREPGGETVLSIDTGSGGLDFMT